MCIWQRMAPWRCQRRFAPHRSQRGVLIGYQRHTAAPAGQNLSEKVGFPDSICVKMFIAGQRAWSIWLTASGRRPSDKAVVTRNTFRAVQTKPESHRQACKDQRRGPCRIASGVTPHTVGRSTHCHLARRPPASRLLWPAALLGSFLFGGPKPRQRQPAARP